MSSTALPTFQEYRALLGRYLRPVRGDAARMGVLILIGISLQLALPLIMRRFIDDVQAGAAMAWLLRLGGLYLLAAVLQQAVTLGATYLSENVGWSATNELRADLAEHLLSLDLSFHNAHAPGEMIERIDGDVTNLANFFSRFMVQVLGNLLLLIGMVVLLSLVNGWVGLTIAVFVGLTLFLLYRTRHLAVPYWKAERQAGAELFGFLEERLSGVEDVRANGGGAYVMNRFYTFMRELMRRSLKAALMINIFLNTTLFMFAVGNATAFVVGAYLFGQKAISLGTVYLIFQFTMLLQRPLEDISRQMQDFQRAGAGLSRVNELFQVRSRLEHTWPPGDEPFTQALQEPATMPAIGVRFEQVTFAYPDAPPAPTASPEPGDDDQASDTDAPPVPTTGGLAPTHAAGELVLDDLSFTIEPGMILGLLGRTGSGKTSLTRLLFRLYDPQAGVVQARLAGSEWVDIRRLPLQAWRRRVGMIPQHVQVFNASVRDNLTFFDPAIPDPDLHQALAAVGLEDWLAGRPGGLDSLLEAGGAGLSAGQAQLLAFARIFLRRPGLVILDEASSRLDPASEAHMESAVSRLVEGRTALIVAHRLGTVQRATHILILEAGRVVEFGPRLALAADPASRFYRLLQTGMEEVLA